MQSYGDQWGRRELNLPSPRCLFGATCRETLGLLGVATNNVVDEIIGSLEGVGARHLQAISVWIRRASITLHGVHG